jgi:hypothetical protein
MGEGQLNQIDIKEEGRSQKAAVKKTTKKAAVKTTAKKKTPKTTKSRL